MTRTRAVWAVLAIALAACGARAGAGVVVTDGSGHRFVEHGKQVGEPCTRDRQCGDDAKCLDGGCWITCGSDPCPTGLSCGMIDDGAGEVCE